MDGVGYPASTARSVAREIPARLAISIVLRPRDFLRRLSLSPNWRSNWSSRTEESLEAFIYSAFWKNEWMLVNELSTPCASKMPDGEVYLGVHLFPHPWKPADPARNLQPQVIKFC